MTVYSPAMSRFTFAELGVEDTRWSEALARVDHDVYHLPGYLALEARRMGGRAIAALVGWDDEALLVPLVARDVDGGNARDLSSPYGYAGLLTSGRSDAVLALEAIQFLLDELRQRGYCSLFLRLHPILNASVGGLPSHAVHETGATVVVDLTRPADELWRGVRKSELHQARRLERRGLEVRFETAGAALDDFYDIYLETMHRVSAAPVYFEFDLGYFLELASALGERLVLCTVREGDEVLAAKLYTRSSGIVQNLLGGTRTGALSTQPSVLETIEAMRYFRERGARVLHLGGGVGGRKDSLFHFKEGFSHEVVPYRTMRVILDGETYERYSAERARELGVGVGELAEHEFFPLYRTPAP